MLTKAQALELLKKNLKDMTEDEKKNLSLALMLVSTIKSTT